MKYVNEINSCKVDNIHMEMKNEKVYEGETKSIRKVLMFANETEMRLMNNGTKIVHSIDMNETDT